MSISVMITVINVGRRCREASGGYEKLVYGKKGVFFLYFLITHSHVLFCLGVLFFSNPFAICTSYFRPPCKLGLESFV